MVRRLPGAPITTTGQSQAPEPDPRHSIGGETQTLNALRATVEDGRRDNTMKILEPPRPKKPKTRKCSCGCRFEYTPSDVRHLPPPDGDSVLTCPGCGSWISVKSCAPLDEYGR